MPLGPKPGLLIGFEPAPPFEGSFFSTMIACKHTQADMVNSSAIQDTISLKTAHSSLSGPTCQV